VVSVPRLECSISDLDVDGSVSGRVVTATDCLLVITDLDVAA